MLGVFELESRKIIWSAHILSQMIISKFLRDDLSERENWPQFYPAKNKYLPSSFLKLLNQSLDLILLDMGLFGAHIVRVDGFDHCQFLSSD